MASFSNILDIILLVCLFSPQVLLIGYECSQRLYEAKGEPAAGSNGFTLEIFPLHADDAAQKNGTNPQQPSGYIPGKMYKIILRGWRTQFFVQTFRGFGITATLEKDGKPGGHFDNRRERSEARVAPTCRAAGVSHSNLRPKTEVQLLWQAPEISTDCVLFRTTVIQSRFVWYMNENELSKKFCIIEGYQKVLPKDDPSAECCACNEADYDVEFIGIWSVETHPKDFPSCKIICPEF